MKDSQLDWAMLVLKAGGLPKSGRASARFPRWPSRAVGLAELVRCGGHGAETRSVGHGAVLEEDEVAIVDVHDFAPALFAGSGWR